MPKLKENRAPFGESELDQRLSAAFTALSLLGYNRREGGGERFVSGDNLEIGVRNAALNLIRNVINGETFDEPFGQKQTNKEADNG